MASSFRSFDFAVNFSNVIGNLINFRSGSIYCTDTTLRLDSRGLGSLACNQTKRKWDAINGEYNIKDASSLIFSLGPSPSSSDNSKVGSAAVCTTSAKEVDEESFCDLGLKSHFHLGSNSMPSTKRPAKAATREMMEPDCDLQLSLSIGPSQSIITDVYPASAQFQNGMEASIDIGITSVDDWSTSSCLKPEGCLLLPLTSMDANSKGAFIDTIPKSLLLSGSEVMPRKTVTCSSRLSQQGNINTKICKFQRCRKGARGASGFCIAHGGGRRCQKEGCNKGAEGRTVYCKAHGGGRRCQLLGCTKSAEGRTEYCIAHGGGRRCSHVGCTKASRGKSGLCIRHGGGKRCQKVNCTRSAEGQSGFCISHGGGRRCQFPACSKGAQGSTMYCKAHGGGKRCTAVGCTKGAEGSTPFCKGHGGGKRCSFQGNGVCPRSVHGGTRFCVSHGGGKRCVVPGCAKSARGRTDFCVRHGGGKRCKFEGCGKSAQGRTDFCKAHGGGNRCLWGQEGSNIGINDPSCDRFARRKSGLCAAHAALASDCRVHDGGRLPRLSTASQDLEHDSLERATDAPKEDNVSHKASNMDKNLVGSNVTAAQVVRPHRSPLTLPEGRVHGGRLMAMLASGMGTSLQSGYGDPKTPPVNSAEYIPLLK